MRITLSEGLAKNAFYVELASIADEMENYMINDFPGLSHDAMGWAHRIIELSRLASTASADEGREDVRESNCVSDRTTAERIASV